MYILGTCEASRFDSNLNRKSRFEFDSKSDVPIRKFPIGRTCSVAPINQSINRQNLYSAPYKTWTAALDNVNI